MWSFQRRKSKKSHVDEEKLRKTIHETGYEVLTFKTEPYVKKGLFRR